MSLVRFIGLLFVFIGVLGSCAVAVALLVIMLRFWPLLLVISAACAVFNKFLEGRTPANQPGQLKEPV